MLLQELQKSTEVATGGFHNAMPKFWGIKVGFRQADSVHSVVPKEFERGMNEPKQQLSSTFVTVTNSNVTRKWGHLLNKYGICAVLSFFVGAILRLLDVAMFSDFSPLFVAIYVCVILDTRRCTNLQLFVERVVELNKLLLCTLLDSFTRVCLIKQTSYA